MVHSRMLRYLDEVARAGSIRQAAEHLNIASSAINRQILDLEADLKTQLFHRRPRGLRLTAAGEILIDHIRKTMKDYRRTQERILDLAGMRAGTVVIAAMHGPAEGLIPSVALEFHKNYPRVTIEVQIAHLDEIVKLVDTGDVDLGLLYNIPSQHGLQIIQAIDTKLGAVVGANHPLADSVTTRLTECARYPIVAASPPLTICRTMEAAFRRMNLIVTPVFETNSTAMMKAVVRDDLHVTFLSQSDVGADQRLAYIPIKGAGLPLQSLSLVQRANATLGVASSLFAEQLRLALQGLASSPAERGADQATKQRSRDASVSEQNLVVTEELIARRSAALRSRKNALPSSSPEPLSNNR